MNFIYLFYASAQFLVVAYALSVKDEQAFQQYLSNYGFMSDVSGSLKSDESVVRNAIVLFQDYYKFHPVDGVIRDDMIEFTKRKRCGVSDSPLNYVLHHKKWQKAQVTWHFPRVTPEIRHLAEIAFHLWSSVANIFFVWNTFNPDIYISFKKLNHTMERHPEKACGAFDGKGIELGHAFFPSETQESDTEVHIDADEDWYYGTDYPTNTSMVSFLAVLVHEIGHALGLRHSPIKNAIMYSTYRPKRAGEKVTLFVDDILGIQNLYGGKEEQRTTTKPKVDNTTSTTPSTTSAESRTVSPGGAANGTKIDLCSLKQVDGMLVVNGRMYIFYKKWVWPMNVGSKNYDSPKLITQWLTFLPKDFKRISVIYQRPNNDIVLLVGHTIYQFSIPDLKLRDGWPKSIHDAWKVNENWQVRGIVNTYTGRTYIFYNDNYYAKMDECYFQPFSFGVTSTDFRGVPARFTSVFRYTNGLLYFFDKKNYYEYNEYTNTLNRAGIFSLDLFNIECVKESVLDQLKNLLSRLSFLHSTDVVDDNDDDDE